MNIGVVIQARMSSSRLPGKILKELPGTGGATVLETVVKRAAKAFHNPCVIVATSDNSDDDIIQKEALKYGASVYRGSLNDVLSRYVGAVKKFKLDYIVRITSDCPCIDPQIIKSATLSLIDGGYDYASNVEERTFPHGLDTEAFTSEALLKADRDEKRPEIREHVTYHIRLSDGFKKFKYTDTFGLPPRPDIRVTLDTLKDYAALCALFTMLPKDFSLKDIIEIYDLYPELSHINSDVYQKNPFTDKKDELVEAVKLLQLHSMDRAAEIIKREQNS